MLLWCEVAFVCTHKADCQKDCTDDHVETVEASRHVKCCAIVQASEWKRCFQILIRLNGAEQQTQKDRRQQTFFQTFAVAMDECMVRPSDGGARAQQDQCVEQRKLHRIKNFEALWRPLHQSGGAFLADQVGDRKCMRFGILHDFQRHREQREVKPRPKPAHEEHDFRRDEHDHAVTQVKLNHRGMIARMGFSHNIRPPCEKGVQYAQQAKAKDEATITELLGMHPHHEAEEHRQGRERTQDGRDARRQNMIIVIFGTRHGQFPVVLTW